MIASRLAPILKSVSGSGLSLKGKTKTTEASAQKQADEVETVLDKDGKEHAADSPKGKMIINMTKEQEAPEMFGGMDLNKIKSALDEDSPLGMPEEVKGGVYKQIFEVNKMMLGSLQRIEGTLKLMLNLEYERALAFQQADVQQNLIEGDTDPVPDDPEAGPGRFRRGLSSARGMLGGAYGKFKGSSIVKMLGLGALIFAFNKYKEEIIEAMAGTLKYFSDVYDVFKSDGIGAAFDKVVDDFKNIFLPKLQEISMNILDFLWGAIKGVAVRWLMGAQGDELVAQESTEANIAMSNLTDSATDAGKAVQKLKTMGKSDVVLNRVAGTMKGLTEEETSGLKENMKAFGLSLSKISKETNGRIQFTGLGDLSGNVAGKFVGLNYPVSTLLNTKPIIDGVISEFSDLENIRLNELAGITRGMSDERVDKIEKNLRDRTSLAQSIFRRENDPDFVRTAENSMLGSTQRNRKNEEDATKLTADKLKLEQLKTVDLGQIFAPIDPKSDTSSFSSKKLSVVEQIKLDKELKRVGMPGGSVSAFYDNKSSTNISAPTHNNMGLSANPTNDSVITSRNAQLLGALI